MLSDVQTLWLSLKKLKSRSAGQQPFAALSGPQAEMVHGTAHMLRQAIPHWAEDIETGQAEA